MNLNTARVLLTGAAGGIGSEIAAELLQRGAAVLLVDLDEVGLRKLVQNRLSGFGDRVGHHAGNLTSAVDRAAIREVASRWRGGVNVLINNAGVSHFRLLESQSPESIELALAVNLSAPIQLCRELLPVLKRHAAAHILNTGSVFGNIGYPAYSVYCATKFGIRGFSESLRRELADTSVRVHYLAPRATRTGINTAAVEEMNAELKVAMDTPDVVARAVCDMLQREDAERVVGWPEKLFARINAVVPRLVDRSIVGQLPIIRHYAQQTPATVSESTVIQRRKAQ